jgi:hypothetical protein
MNSKTPSLAMTRNAWLLPRWQGVTNSSYQTQRHCHNLNNQDCTAKSAHHVHYALTADELEDAIAGNHQERVIAAQVAELQLWLSKHADTLSSCSCK